MNSAPFSPAVLSISKAVLGSQSHPARISTISCPEPKSRQEKSDVIKVCLGAGESMGISCPATVILICPGNSICRGGGDLAGGGYRRS